MHRRGSPSDDLSYVLRAINVGCFIDNTCTNHYFYADDMCLLAPSAGGLQKLIDACSKYGNEHDILYNSIKSKCMIFLPKRYKLTVPTVSLDGNTLDYEDQIKYLVLYCLLIVRMIMTYHDKYDFSMPVPIPFYVNLQVALYLSSFSF